MKRTLIAPESKKHPLTEVGEGIAPPKDPIDPPSHRRRVAQLETERQYVQPLERITRGTVVIRNVKFPGADAAYPDVLDALFRFVSSYYPYAVGGPLYVDEPKNEKEVHRAYERQKVMKKLNHRYVIVEKDTCYEDLMDQLGVF